MTVSGATTIDAHQAKKLHDRGAAFVDVRTQELWDTGHIPGAHFLESLAPMLGAGSRLTICDPDDIGFENLYQGTYIADDVGRAKAVVIGEALRKVCQPNVVTHVREVVWEPGISIFRGLSPRGTVIAFLNVDRR